MAAAQVSEAILSNVDESEDHQDEVSGSARRKQVYDAQKRHRQRRNDYVRTLEAEISRLRAMDAATNLERDALAKQNTYLQAMLPSPAQTGPSASSWMGATVSVQHDQIIDRERIFVEPLKTAEQVETSTIRPGNDSWAALDFILALEWPCRYHIAHPVTNADGEVQPCGNDFGGHSMTRTAAVLAASRLHSVQGIDSGVLDRWQLPSIEIENHALGLDDLITPAQAYAETRSRVGQDVDLGPVLDSLKIRLAEVLHCEGLGAVIPMDSFRQHLEEVLRQQASSTV